ncbi:glycerol-3-phosphate acyltransferase [Chloroflexota bacterium]
MIAQTYFIPIAIVCAYLIGSIPTAYIVTRLSKDIDIRAIGSQNMGAMNVFYKVGFIPGLLVLAVDIGKGASAIALARWLGVPMIYELLAGLAAVIGHIFPIFLNFYGGKGGATLIGIFAFLMPWGIPLYVTLFGICLLLTRYPTLSYSVAFLCFPFIAWLGYHSFEFSAFSICLLLIPAIRYIPRIKEMRAISGSWHHVLVRQNMKDRL